MKEGLLLLTTISSPFHLHSLHTGSDIANPGTLLVTPLAVIGLLTRA